MTMRQWFDESSEEAVKIAVDYMALTKKEGYVWGTIRTAMGSVSERAIVLMQDYLNLGAEARMNFPGKPSGNWTWRAKKGYLSGSLSGRILEITQRYDRC